MRVLERIALLFGVTIRDPDVLGDSYLPRKPVACNCDLLSINYSCGV